MSLVITWSQRLDDPALDVNGRALLCCQIAGEMEKAGDYEGARQAMSGLWEHVGERPRVDGLERIVAAEVLLRAGSLSGWISSTRQVEGGQEEAKDLLSESSSIFTELKRTDKAAEASIGLALCYWREGGLDDALVVLKGVLKELGDEKSEIKSRAVLNKAMVESAASRWAQAISSLTESAALFEACDNQALKGSFYNTLATALKNLGTAENRPDYIDRALIEYAAASLHFERAGHRSNRARVENNLGMLFRSVGKFEDAHEHLDYARRIFVTLKDSGSVAQVDETRARVFLDQRKPAEAERLTRLSVRTLETGGEQVLLVEALTTHGIALARLGRAEQARASFERAIEIAEQTVSRESAGLPALTLLEELGGKLTRDERRAAYDRADKLFGDTMRPEMLSRLRVCARRIFASQPRHAEEVHAPTFVYRAAETAGLLRLAHRIAGVQSPVLLSGETGTGKEELARLIHEWSGRAGEFVLVNCAAITGLPIEAYLFGYSEGTFAEFPMAGVGVARKACGGTLLFDEIAALSLADQGKLMRFIEQGEIHPIGAPEPERVDVRIIATTSRQLKHEVQQGRFRDDLFYRLEAFSLLIPPLRERAADIAPLAEHFLKQACAASDKQVTFTPAGLQALGCLPLHGNARELRSLIEHTVLAAADGTALTGEAVETMALRRMPPPSLTEPWAGCSLDEEVLRYEGELIKHALDTAGGSVTRAARLLGVTHQGLAFILQGRQKNLLPARTPARPRRRSLMRPVQR